MASDDRSQVLGCRCSPENVQFCSCHKGLLQNSRAERRTGNLWKLLPAGEGRGDNQTRGEAERGRGAERPEQAGEGPSGVRLHHESLSPE